jgi:hypothetical protein
MYNCNPLAAFANGCARLDPEVVDTLKPTLTPQLLGTLNTSAPFGLAPPVPTGNLKNPVSLITVFFNDAI